MMVNHPIHGIHFCFLMTILEAAGNGIYIEIEKFVPQITSEWTSTNIIPGVRSLIECSTNCGQDNPSCNVFWFDKSTKECKIGLIYNLDIIGPGIRSICKLSWLQVSVTVKVRNMNNNNPISGVNLIAKSVQDANHHFEALTDQHGEAKFQFMRKTSLIIDMMGSGIFHMVANAMVADVFEQTITLSTATHIPAQHFKAVLEWGCCINDMDLSAQLRGATSCTNSIGNRVCSRGSNGKVELGSDITSYLSDEGETLDWTGTFPSEDVHVIGVKRYGSYGSNHFHNTGLNLFVMEGSDTLLQINPKPEVTDKGYWVAGCFKPSLGLSSFQEINVYSDSVDVATCPLIT